MEGGKGSVSFSTGMAALSAIFTTLLRRGDHLVSSQYVFSNTNSLLGTLLELGVEISFVDATDSAQVRGRSGRIPAWCSPRPSPTPARRWPTWR